MSTRKKPSPALANAAVPRSARSPAGPVRLYSIRPVVVNRKADLFRAEIAGPAMLAMQARSARVSRPCRTRRPAPSVARRRFRALSQRAYGYESSTSRPMVATSPFTASMLLSSAARSSSLSSNSMIRSTPAAPSTTGTPT